MEEIKFFKGEYGFLSNFHPSPLEWEGVTFPTLEHAYQAAKSNDINERWAIAGLKTAGVAKKAGRKLPLPEDWDVRKVEVMRALVAIKFSSDELRDKLLSTGTATLVEGNWWGDYFWGVCRGKGENMLGRILMAERDRLRQTESGNE